MDAYVARQPIFNCRKKIFGYELLFRDATAKMDPGIHGDAATSTFLGNSFFNIGMDNLINGKKSFLNSAFFAKAQDIASIQQALVYMGEAKIRRFISLVAMANLAKGKPDELIRASCIRAKFCELLGDVTPWPAKPAELFTLGMFSLIDAILDQPMERIMKELPLSDGIKECIGPAQRRVDRLSRIDRILRKKIDR